MSNAPKALVTGASGFVGSTLVEELAKAGFDVYALLRKTSSTANLKNARYTRVEGDLSTPEALRAAVKGMDYVFHCAGTVAAPDRETYFRHNADGTRHVIEAVAEANPGLKRFVLISSLAAGGPSASLTPVCEGDPEKPVSAYGESKLQGEREVLKYKDRLPVAIVRPPMVYGPRDTGVFTVIQTVSKRFMPLIRGATESGDKYYSSVHVADLVNGIIKVAQAPALASGEIFYFNSTDLHTMREMLSAMAEALELKPFRFPVPSAAIKVAAYSLGALGKVTKKSYPLNPDKLNELLPDYWICSSEKARRTLGFTPQYDLKAGMADAIRWYKEERWL